MTARSALALLTAMTALALSGCSAVSDLLEEQDQSIFSLQVGECLDSEALEGDASSVPRTDCAEPHDLEVFHGARLNDEEYPGEAAAARRAESACYAAFDDFVGMSFELALINSAYSFRSLYPTGDSWDLGDREILCLVAATDDEGNIKPVEGSLKGVEQ
jgi:hypothetical protein